MYLLIALAMQLHEDGTSINRTLIKNEFFVPSTKLLIYKRLFPIYYKSIQNCIENPLCFGFSALGLD